MRKSSVDSKPNPIKEKVKELTDLLDGFLENNNANQRQQKEQDRTLNSQLDQVCNTLTSAELEYKDQLNNKNHYSKKKKEIEFGELLTINPATEN